MYPQYLYISTIFKTINSSVDETRKTLALFNKDWNAYKTNWQQGFSENGFIGGIKSIFQSNNQKSVISKDQIQMVRTWNNAIKNTCTNQETFNRIIANADDTTKMYFAGLNKGKASIEGLKNAQNVAKQSTIGLTIAQTALNAALSIGFTAAISLAIKGLDSLINSSKRASEAADEAFSKTNEKVQQNEEELKSLEELIAKYRELKESGDLDINSRKEVKEIQNDIADLVGTQAKNLDLVNGKLDEEIKKLDKISENEAKNAYETAIANYNNAKKANEEATADDSFLFIDGYAYTGKREKEAEKILIDAGFDGNVQSGGFFGNTLFVTDAFDFGNGMKELEGAQEKADYLQSMIDILEQNGQRATDLYSGLIAQRDTYLKYIDSQQGAANSLVNSWITYSQFSNNELSKINVDSLETFKSYRQKMIDEAKNDESIGAMMSDGILSEQDLETAINDFMATSNAFSEWYDRWINGVKDKTSNIEDTSEATITFKTAFNAKEFEDTKNKLLELAKAGELTPYTLSSTKEYNTLLQQTGLTAEQAYKRIMKIAKADMDLTDWQTSLENARKSIISLKEMKQSLNEDGVSAVTDDVIANYPMLIQYLENESQLRDGINGLISDYENMANEAYFNLMQTSETYYTNLKNKEAEKLAIANQTINGILNSNQTLVDQLGRAYNVDLTNYKSIAEAKAGLEQQLITNSAEAWSKYYKVQFDATRDTATVVAGDSSKFKSGGTGGSDSIAAYEEASKAQNAINTATRAYNKAIEALKSITNTSISANITSPSTTSSTPSSKKSGGSGGTKKATETYKKFSQVIDWCAETITNLTNKITNLNAKLANVDGIQKQIKYYKQLVSAQKGLVKGYEQTANRYQKVYNKALKKLSKADKKKVVSGIYTIEQFKGKTKSSSKKKSADEKRYDNIQAAIKARDNVFSTDADLENAKAQLDEYIKTLINIRWDKATEKIEKLNQTIDLLDAKRANASGYATKNALIDESLKVKRQQVDEQKQAILKTKGDKQQVDNAAEKTKKKIKGKYKTKARTNEDGTLKTGSDISDKKQLQLINQYNKKKKEASGVTATKKKIDKQYKTKARTNKDGTLKTTGIKDKEQLSLVNKYNKKVKANSEAKTIKKDIDKKYKTPTRINKDGTLKTKDVTDKKQLKLLNQYNQNIKKANGADKIKKKIDNKYTTKERTNKDGTLKTKGVKDKDQLALIKKYNQKVKASDKAKSIKGKINDKYKTTGRTNADGTLKTKGITDKKQLALIKQYNAQMKTSITYTNELADKEEQAAIAEEEYLKAKTDATLEKADNIIASYENKMLHLDAREAQLNSEISLAEASGQVASGDYYKQLAKISKDRIPQLEEEKALLLQQQNELEKYSDGWYDLQRQINDVDQAVRDETLNAVENINKQYEALKKLTQAKNNYYNSVKDSLSFLESLTRESDLYDDKGQFTDKAYAVIKAKLSVREVDKQIAKNASDKLNDLDEKYNASTTHTDAEEAQYLTRRIELANDYTDALKNMYSDEKALHDMLINQLKKESEALKDLISKKKESLRADKSERDYQKSLAEKSKNLTDLQKQRAMYEGDNSEEGMAKRQQLDVAIADAKDDIDDMQYEKYLERLEDGLDELQDRFDAVIEKMDKQATAESVNELIDTTKDKVDEITKGTNMIINDAGFSEYLKGENDNLGIGKLNSTAQILMGASNDKIEMLNLQTRDGNEDLSSIKTNTGDTATNTNTTASNTGETAYNTGETSTNTDKTSGNTAKTSENVLNGANQINSKIEANLTNGDQSAADYLNSLDAKLGDVYTAQIQSQTHNNGSSGGGSTPAPTNTTSTNTSTTTSGSSGGGTYGVGSGYVSSSVSKKEIENFIKNNLYTTKKKYDELGPLNQYLYDYAENELGKKNRIMTQDNMKTLSYMLGIRSSNDNSKVYPEESYKIINALYRKNIKFKGAEAFDIPDYDIAGYANGGLVEKVVRNGDDGIASLKVGEAVLTPAQTTALMELGDKLAPLNKAMDFVPKTSIPTNIQKSVDNSSSTTIDSVNFEFNLPNVVDSESLIKTIQTDTKVQKTLQNATVGKLNGNTKFGVNRL